MELVHFFGVVVREIWLTRNQLVFSGKSSNFDSLWFAVMSQMKIITRDLTSPTLVFIEDSQWEVSVSWVAPKVNVDDSFRKSSGVASCGGLIRGSSGRLVKGFFCNLGLCNVTWAELWALRLGIKLAKSFSLSQVIFELDSQVVVNMIQLRGSHNHFLQSLLDKILDLLNSPNWRTTVSHVYREANCCADFLANKGHCSSFSWTVIDRLHPY